MVQAKRLATTVIVAWVANIIKVLIQLIMFPVMARLLGPSEMGLYTLSMPIMAFVGLLSDGGLGNSLAREKADNHQIWSTAFWGLQISGVVLALGVIISSVAVAEFAGQPRFVMIMAALSTTFLMVGASVIPAARLVQKGRLAIGPVGDMVGNLMGASLGVYCAFHGFGVWSMVVQYVSGYAFRTITLNIVEFYRPRLHFDLAGLKSHMMMGGAITSGKLFDLGGRILENAQISRVLGAGILGAYGFANQISRFLCEAASNAIWSNLYYLSLHGTDEEVRSGLVRLTRLLALVLFPSCGVLAATSTTLLPHLIGDRWADAGWPLAIMAAMTPFGVLGHMSAAVVYGKGLMKVPFWVSVATAAGRLGVVAFAGWLNLNALCFGLGIVSLLQGLALIFFTRPIIGHNPYTLMKHLMWPLFMSAMCAVIFYYVVSDTQDLLTVAGGLGGCIVLFFGGLFILDKPLFAADIKAVSSLIRKKS